MFRRFVFLLICLGLMLQAPALRAQDTPPCPMQATMQAMLVAGDLDPAGLPDCCNDLLSYAATGHACKTGADCGTPPVIAFATLPTTAMAAAASALAPAQQPAARAAPIANPWRPPAST